MAAVSFASVNAVPWIGPIVLGRFLLLFFGFWTNRRIRFHSFLVGFARVRIIVMSFLVLLPLVVLIMQHTLQYTPSPTLQEWEDYNAWRSHYYELIYNSYDETCLQGYQSYDDV